ncbi:hypothetical protein [Spirosoma pollinicola]|uniref:Uncharacterized protein n=1 Tax=Spirosoma pollinicola TaxID=2057025 RepID=A0A2K8ZA22_9BACT|nr:hypothetical protein [Spirosoma pollinicola]AUD06723.1 hypothetical protein CWM47_35695 [Spirosoma pollinicola]
MPFGAVEEQIIDAAKNYSTVLHKATELVSQATDDLFSGTPATIYLKKMGHRQLTSEELKNIITALGSAEDKQIVQDFQQAQLELSQRLQNTKNIGLLLKQAKIPYQQAYARFSRSDLWKPEQMIQIMEVLRRLQL